MEDIKRIDTKKLFRHMNLTELQRKNSELNLLESSDRRAVVESKPRRIVLELTNTCNFNCVMCGRNHGDFKPAFFSTSWLENIRPYMDAAEEITLMGWGEPTIHPAFIKFLEFADEYPVNKYILTNGSTLDSIYHMLFEYKVNILAISLDGPDAKTNDQIRSGSSFSSITSNIREFVTRRMFASVKPHINTVTTLMKRNIRAFPRMIDLAAELGIEEVKGVYLTAFSKELESETLFDSSDLLKDVLSEARERADKYNIILSLPYIPGDDPAGDSVHRECHLAWRDLFIGCDGRLRSCMSSANVFSNVMNKNLRNGPRIVEFRKRVNDDPEFMSDACRHCYQSACANWNLRHSFIQTDTDFHPDWG